MKALVEARTAVGAVDNVKRVPAASYCTAGEWDDNNVKIHLIYLD